MESRRPLLVALALAVAVAAVYGRALGFGFVDFDDPDYVARNPHVLAGLTADGARWAFTTGHASNWHPLTWLSLMLDAELFGSGARGFHATNAVLHAVGALLLFGALRSMTGRLGPSAFVAGLFALHPVHVESVAWISERKDVLSVALGLGAIRAYAAFARTGRRSAYVACAALLAAGLLAKPTLVTLPLLLLLLDVWPLRRPWGRERILEKVPLALLCAASCAVTLAVQEEAMSLHVGVGERLATAAVACVRYLGLAVWPDSLFVLRPHPYMPGGTPPALWQVAGSVLLLAGTTALAVRARARFVLVGWLWFLVALLPMIGIVQVGRQGMADRYAYLPFIGLYVLLAWGVEAWRTRSEPARATAPIAAGALLLLAGLGTRAWSQVGTWRDSETLFRHALEEAPRSPFLRANLANVLLARGDADEAIPHYERAVDEMPRYALALGNLGLALQSVGRAEEALARFRAALVADPASADAHFNLGQALQRGGALGEALEHYRTAVELDAELADAHVGVAGVRLASGRVAEAVADLQRAVELDPDHTTAHFNLGYALGALGRRDEAIVHYVRALELDPTLVDARVNLGQLYLARSAWDDALEQFRAAERGARDHLGALTGLARVLASHADPAQRDPGAAVAFARRAVEIAGGASVEVLVALAEAQAAGGAYAAALETGRTALTLAEEQGATALAEGIRGLLARYESLDS